ncbi:MAG: Ppx/GppA family phosphatase [candidate division NC10 bacterium]|nr:Ppx/GppA family phosphatase [candidate division NC10 bacterium]
MPIYAAIDVGTNTIRLLVAEADAPGDFRLVSEEQAITRLGEDLLRTGSLKEEAMVRTTAVLRRYAEIARRHGAEAVLAVATSAVREAMNGEDFSAKVLEETGLALRIIPSEEEARLAILGVSRALGFPSEDLLVLDVGGGSVEFALARDVRPKAIISTDLGVVKLTEGFLKSDPPTLGELQALREAIRRRIKGVRASLPDLRGALLVGTGGTATTLAAIHLKLVVYDPEKVNGTSLSLEQVEGLLRSLAKMSHRERLQVPGLEQGREDLIVAGAAVVLETMQGLSFPSLLISDGGLREGILLDLLERRFKPS